MFIIKKIKAREILDSRGVPTIEVDLSLSDNSFGRAAVPSGASLGSKEAVELRDGGTRFFGNGVLKAVDNVNNIIAKAILKEKFHSQAAFDRLLIDLDGTLNKQRLGANAILATSLAFAKAMANAHNLPLFRSLNPGGAKKIPIPMMNILNGGVHADNQLDIQEFMVIPVISSSIKQSLEIVASIVHHLKNILKKAGLNTNVGDEGGFAPNLRYTNEALDLIILAIEAAGYKAGIDIMLALDVAANELYKDGIYTLKGGNQVLNTDELITYYSNLVEKYPILFLEDPISEHDYLGWQKITSILKNRVNIIGDDLFVTNKKILAGGIKDKIANSILIKINQIGTLTETLETISLAQQNNYYPIISHRSGETEDTTIAHLAVATNSPYIKTGSICRTDRVCKYNELIRIEEQLDQI